MAVLPPELADKETLIKETARISMESMANTIAKLAEELAPTVKEIDGEMALLAFAKTIRSQNGKVWPKGSGQ